MADPLTIGVVGGGALLLADALDKNKGVSQPQGSGQAAAKQLQAIVRQGDIVDTALANTFQNDVGRSIVIRGVQAGVGIALSTVVAIFTAGAGPLGVVIGVAIAILAITIGGIIELYGLIHDLAANEQWRAVEQYERDWQSAKKNGIARLKLWAASEGKTVGDADADAAASAFADGYMIRLTLQKQWAATFTDQGAGLRNGLSGWNSGGQLGWGDWTNAWRASNTGKVYGTPIAANWERLQRMGIGRIPDIRYGGGEDWNLWTLPARKSPVGAYQQWYNAGRTMANVSGFVAAMQQPVSAGQSLTSHAAYWRERGLFQGALRQDVPLPYPIPVLEFEGQLWAWTGVAGAGGFQPVFLGSA